MGKQLVVVVVVDDVIMAVKENTNYLRSIIFYILNFEETFTTSVEFVPYFV